jgi:hypothetical protein
MIGLFLGLRILEAHSPQTPMAGRDQDNETLKAWQDIRSQLEAINPNVNERVLPLSSLHARRVLQGRNVSGEAVANVVVDGQMYRIDDQGIILGTSDPFSHADVPIVTGDDFQVHFETFRIAHPFVDDLVTFLQTLYTTDPSLTVKVSEIHLDRRLGLIAYVDNGHILPIVLGQGSMKRKVRYLNALSQHYSLDAIESHRFVDLRLNGQIVIKNTHG